MSTMLLRRIFMLLCVGCLSTAALAADVNWVGGNPNTPDWGIASNWDLGVPTVADNAWINLNGAAVVVPAGESYETATWEVGRYANNTLYVGPGATLTGTSGRSYVAREGGQSIGVLTVDGTVDGGDGITLSAGASADATIIVNEGGTLTTNLFLFGDWVGTGFGRLIMNGGLVDIFQMGSWLHRQTVILDLNDGVYDVQFLNPDVLALYDDPDGSLSVDIDHGKWVVEDSDITTDIATMIGRGEIVAFGGQGSVEYDYDISTPGRTTVYATHPLNQTPEWKGFVVVPTAGGTATLEWDNYVGGTAEVWLGTEPDKLSANYTMISSSSVGVGTRSSITSSTLLPGTTYYWQVDLNGVEGPVFEFLATDNGIPEVSVKNVITWLDPPYTPGNEAVVLMDATVVDDTPGLTYAWTLEPAGDPNVLFDSTTIEDPTLTINSTGIRTLTLTVDDGQWIVSESAEVRVYENPCWAARVSPGYAGDPAGDIANNNCTVNLEDFAALAATWMDDTALTEIAYY